MALYLMLPDQLFRKHRHHSGRMAPPVAVHAIEYAHVDILIQNEPFCITAMELDRFEAKMLGLFCTKHVRIVQKQALRLRECGRFKTRDVHS